MKGPTVKSTSPEALPTPHVVHFLHSLPRQTHEVGDELVTLSPLDSHRRIGIQKLLSIGHRREKQSITNELKKGVITLEEAERHRGEVDTAFEGFRLVRFWFGNHCIRE